jgi:MraZ protein
MDDKGRVSLPSPFRRGGADDRFVLLQWETPYLTLFPESKWAEVEARLLEYRKNGREAMNQVRLLFSGLVEVTLDKQGRILVPSSLQEAAGLKGTVLLLGMSDRVELWDPETYEEKVRDGAGDFQQLAHKLFA